MTRAPRYASGFLVDFGVVVALFLQWLVVSLVVDATVHTGGSLDIRKGASVWLTPYHNTLSQQRNERVHIGQRPRGQR